MKHFLLILIVACISGCFGTEPQKTGKEGKSMPTFSLLALDSTTWIHSTDIAVGKPTVLIYFSPYCPYCKAQTEKIIDDIDMLKDIQFYFISGFPLADVKEFNKQYQLNKYPNIITTLDSAGFVNDYYEVPGFPYIIIYGKDKKLRKAFLGKMYNSQLKKIAEE